MCVCDVAAVAGVSKAVASYHLRLLYRMGLVSYRKDGRLVYYSLAAHDIVPVIEAALRYAQEKAERSAPVPAGVGERRD
jgi:DNA-binding transcriptional ArsR family regulator